MVTIPVTSLKLLRLTGFGPSASVRSSRYQGILQWNGAGVHQLLSLQISS